MTDDVLVRVRNVSKAYTLNGGLFGARKDLRALKDVSLSLRRGECLAVVGESGSGKSTLASIIMGLERPTSGTVLMGETPIEQVGRRTLAKRIQPVFQDPYASLNPSHTIRAIVGRPLKVHSRSNSQEHERAVRDCIERVGLHPDVLDRYPSQLSGGQRQRVAIARALVSSPEVVVLDEPTSALDVSIQAQILNLLSDLRADLGLTYLFISHDLGVVNHIADRVVVMRKGEIVEEGPAQSVFNAPRHPYTQMLLASILDIHGTTARVELPSSSEANNRAMDTGTADHG